MNILEAIKCAGDNLFKMKGHYGYGLSINKNGYLQIHEPVLGVLRERDYNLCCIEELTGEWEIVTPEQVLAERKS